MVNLATTTGDDAEDRIRLFDFAFDNAPIGIALVDTTSCILRGNKSFSRMVGIPMDELSGTPIRAFSHPDDIDADMALFTEVLKGEREGYVIEKRYVRPDQSIVHVRITITAMRAPGGKVVRFISQIEDISQQKKAERELVERATLLELAMEAVRGGFWYLDVQSGKFETSDQLTQFVGGRSANVFDMEAYFRRINPEDVRLADLTPLLSGQIDQSVIEYRLTTVAGERWMRCDQRLLRDPDGLPFRVVGVVIDLTEELQRIQQSELMADTDVLTGLLNRRGLKKRFDALSPDSGVAVLTIDLDGFKEINDKYGHPAGDLVLTETARRLKEVISETDLACRMGGDEFILVLNGDPKIAEKVARDVVVALRESIDLEGDTLSVRASVGGTWTATRPFDLDRLVYQADSLLYQAKAAGKDTWRLCTPSSERVSA